MKGDPVLLRKSRMPWSMGAMSAKNAPEEGGSDRARTAME